MSEVTFPLKRGDSLVHRLLRAHEPYILTGTAASTFEELIRHGHVDGELSEIEPPPVTITPRNTLVFFSGDRGDSVCTYPALGSTSRRIDFVSPHADPYLFLGQPVYEYPITLRQAMYYDQWVEFDARANPQEDPNDAFAAAVGVTLRPDAVHPQVFTHPEFDAPVQSIIEDTGRPKLAIRVYAEGHYRSWQAHHAMITMTELRDAGYDCYVIGDAKHRIVFVKDGVEQRMWSDGIYDASGLFSTDSEMTAFISGMDGVIAPDGGTMNLALAMGKPVLGLFGPTAGAPRVKYWPSLYPMYGQTIESCAPCWCVNDRPPCDGKWCDAILEIEPLKIVAKVKEMLRHD